MKLFSGHDAGGCAFYRMILPHTQLAAHGWDVTWVNASLETGAGFTSAGTRGHDVIAAQRVDKPGSAHVWRDCRTATSRLVLEQDDNVFAIGKHNWSAYEIYSRERVQDMVMHAMEVADMVTTTTATLADVLSEFNANVVVLPNCIPAWVCGLDPRPHDRPRVGWMGGASHGLDVGVVAGPVRRFLKRHADWQLSLVGTDYRPTFELPKDRAVFTKWIQVNDDAEGYYRLPDFDVGLAPLTPDVFNQSKSPLKAMEYGALGIPVIASDWPPYREYVRHGETGFLVKRDHEWLHYMSLLANDEALRQKMGAAAREQARENTIEGNWQKWDTAYRGLFQ